ncbi:hypothetical protein BDB00DRAFT_942520, partial [Zychaea mexicana]|uniref:uncharacterized protein n=1 Tax=Zychaea mexicana TaxID=64656 RepID=UPI0022FF4579
MLRIPSSVPDDDERKHGDNYHSNKNDNNNNVLPSATFASQSAITHSHDAPTTGTTRRNRPHRMSQSSRQFASTSTTTIAAAAAVTPTPTTTFPYTAVAANVSAASLPRSYTKADGLYRLARSQDSQIMHTNVDHQSLMDALFSDSDEALERRSIRRARTTRPDSQVSSSSSTSDSFGRGSIELAISSNSNSSSDEGRQQRALVADDDIVAHAGSETLMDLFGAQKDLEQQMHAIEQQEKDAYAAVAAAAAATRTEREDLLDVDEMEKEEEEHGEKTTTHEQEFEMPSFIRVLYMGAASEKDKRNFMKKLSQAFATLFHYDSPSWLQNPKMFKERKHHLLLMDLVPPDQGGEDQYDNIIETCEDNGLSIIEADFTWSSLSSSSSSSSNEKTTAEDKNNLTFMIEQYVWLQCDSARQYPSDWQQQQQQQVPVYARQKFDGFVYPDKAPNGIDLCVYFYDNNYDEHNVKDRLRTDEDMVILWRLKKLGIPIMPILSSGNTATTTTTTTTRPRSQHHHHYQYPRSTVSSSSSASNPPPLPASSVINTGAAVNTIPTIDERRTQFADLLAQYKIRCVDISLSKLDVGLAPSFQKNAKKK